jgi:SpoVK/Ycf46/Vps4 family AAA+-type ATPase
MRKGADVLSKWVGEAERQLRMLFEEARAAQPSIIFFDEIDGMSPSLSCAIPSPFVAGQPASANPRIS